MRVSLLYQDRGALAWPGRGLRLAAALASAVRVNHRRNIVAADAVVPAYLSELLTIKELSSVAVTAREPADRRSSVGILHGLDSDLTDSELTTGLALTVPILAASKEGGAESGHAAGHSTNALLKKGNQGRSLRGVPRGSLLRCCGQGKPSGKPHQGSCLQRPTPVPRRSIQPPVSHFILRPPPAPPTEPALDLRDALIASLLGALRLVGDALPRVTRCALCVWQRSEDSPEPPSYTKSRAAGAYVLH
ncbi:hypothetical protein HPB51_000427 [Rhipicephalus microplus]|uniref:Uncharacterized protein n=1 Tax=Rhipicephalus microplus TaxID=6941 RepID=A0A9J6EEZ0_RHIMP|nr:hypothetical protein HPB51_000427 [Rhipicephalus microplus]